MKIFLATLESETATINKLISNVKRLKWNLMSYFVIRKNKQSSWEKIINISDKILIDSGAFSFQRGNGKVDFYKYTNEYANWIVKNDRQNIIGFFEMDIDNIVGYDEVLKYREILESASKKIIPVWHKNRGITEYTKMCQNYSGKIVAISGPNKEILDDQYILFLKEAWKYNCRLHGLGITDKKVLNKVPFDYCDSCSWRQDAIHGRIGNYKINRKLYKTKHHSDWKLLGYLEWMKIQEHYYKKWRYLDEQNARQFNFA